MKHNKREVILLFLILGLGMIQATATQVPIDKNHSSIAFHVPIMNGLSKVHGKFTDFDIQLDYNDADASKSSVKAVIKVASIDTGISDRDKDLRSPNFFDVDKNPDISFVSSRVEKGDNQLLVHGTLTMHGVSHEVILPVKLSGNYTDPKTAKQMNGFTANLTLNRRDYGINWTHSALAPFVGDNVDVELEILTRLH